MLRAVDEIGDMAIDREQAKLTFNVAVRRSERASIVPTRCNLPCTQRAGPFGDDTRLQPHFCTGVWAALAPCGSPAS